MRKFLLLNLATLSASLAILTISLYSIHSSNISQQFITDSLAKHNTYDKLAVFLNRSAASNNPLIEKNPYSVTKDVLQTTTEKLIADIAVWLEGKTDQAPQISFADYQSKVAEEQREKILERDVNPISFTPPPGFSEGFNDPFTLAMQVTEGQNALLPIGGRMQLLKYAYQTIKVLQYLAPILLALTLTLLLLLAKKKLKMIKWFAIACAVTAVYALFVLASASIVPGVVSSQLPDVSMSPSIALVSPVIDDIVRAYQTQLQKNLVITTILTLLTAIVLLITYVRLQRAQAKQKTLLAETRLAHAQENLNKILEEQSMEKVEPKHMSLKKSKTILSASQSTQKLSEISQQSAKQQPPEKESQTKQQ